MSALLELRDVTLAYGGAAVVHDVSLSVDEGEIVVVLGANGAGKTTLLRAISGLHRPATGTVELRGTDVTRVGAPRVAAAGVAHVPENRRVFPRYSVERNLRVGGWVRRRDRGALDERIEQAYAMFPVLGERRNGLAGSLSGGEQQMLAMAMALVADPSLLLLDEPSLGLAPKIIGEVFEHVERLRASGCAVLLVEQRAREALRIADRGVVLHLGRVTAAGTAAQLQQEENVVSAYLGRRPATRAASA